MVEYTIDDIRGPTVAREMAQLKEFVLARFNRAIADAEAAAAAAATAAANAVLANTVKKTGEASQSIAGDVAVTGALDAAGIGSSSTPIVCGDLTAFGSVSLDDTVLQGNLGATDSSALIDLDGVGSVLVPNTAIGTYNTDAANAKRVKDELDAYAPMIRSTGNQTKSGILTLNNVLNGISAAYQTESSGSLTVGNYQMMIKIPKSEITYSPVRGHIFVGICVRGGASGLDIIDISTNSKTPTGILMALPRGLQHNVTYVVSHDTDNIYISRVNLGNNNDGVCAAVYMTWGVSFSANIAAGSLITPEERNSSTVAGTEIARVNNA